MREILTDWTTEAGSGFVSVTYWDQQPTIADQRAAWGAFLTDIDVLFAGGTTWSVRTEGRTLNEATGQLNGAWVETTEVERTSIAGGSQTPDASQGLVRWITGQYIGGRQIRGRTFIPGVGVAATSDGNLGGGAQTAIGAAATALVAAGVGFGVWHRPKDGSPGELCPVTGGTAWSEMAVLRQRRG